MAKILNAKEAKQRVEDVKREKISSNLEKVSNRITNAIEEGRTSVYIYFNVLKEVLEEIKDAGYVVRVISDNYNSSSYYISWE